jgi:flagellin
MTVINTNIGATITANALAKNERAMNTAMERLSTGKRINSAADDAAGLAISQRLNAQVKGLDQAARNANDAISMLQTADGAAIEITNMLQRMRELAVQATSDSNTSADVSNLDLEFKALAEEIDRIVDATQWNGENILDGTGGDSSDGSFTFQIGANDGQTVSVDFSDFNLAAGTSSTTAVAAVYSSALDDTAATGIDGDFVISDGTTTITLDYSTTSPTDLDAIITDIQADSSYGDLLFTVAANTAGDGIDITYSTAGAITTAPTVTADDGGSDVAGTISEDTAGVTASTGVVMGADISGMASTTATITTETANIIDTLDTAISGVTTQRATFGAVMNRLEYTVDNLANVSQNTSASMSRIADADYAAETTELARTQIIQQAGTAMLSQANQQAQSVLALLK